MVGWIFVSHISDSYYVVMATSHFRLIWSRYNLYKSRRAFGKEKMTHTIFYIWQGHVAVIFLHIPLPFWSLVTLCVFCYRWCLLFAQRLHLLDWVTRNSHEVGHGGETGSTWSHGMRQQWKKITLTPVANTAENEPQLSPGVHVWRVPHLCQLS